MTNEIEQPEVNRSELRKQQLNKQLGQVYEKISELHNQRRDIEQMIGAATTQADMIRGAITEIQYQEQIKTQEANHGMG